jgi:glycosyltransferase involved in cell wall biosynthesis
VKQVFVKIPIPMKVLMLTPYLGSIYGGPSKVVKELAQEISHLGIKVDIVTTNANSSSNLDSPIDTWILEKYYRVQYFSCWHRHDFIISLPLANWLFHNVINYDVVHTHTIFSPLISFAHWVCKVHQVPYIITPHGMLEPWALSYKAWKKQFYYALCETFAFKGASAFQVLTAAEANNVKSLGLTCPSIVVPNGIHCKEFELLQRPEMFYEHFPSTRHKDLILFLGRIDPKKGLDLLAPAFASVHRQFPQSHLVVAGPDIIGFLPTVQAYFSQAGCLDAVTFTGMITGSLKSAALAAASFYVAPSYSEGFSMSVLEAMASGLPCVITTGCNFPEATREQAVYIVNINTDEITKALIQCFSAPGEARKIGERARNFVFQNYTWEHSAKKLAQVYYTIVKKTNKL